VKLYLDSSAIVKLVQREAESDALGRFLRRHRDDMWVTSALARVEVVCAVLPAGAAAVSLARRQVARLYEVALDADLLDRAARLAPTALLRTLDRIHVASAQLLGADLRAVVTYDRRMTDAAVALKLPVKAPG